MLHLLLGIIYLAFVSLGLPDSLLGAAWPQMFPRFAVPVSYAGIISMIIAAGTIVSSLQCERFTSLLGTGRVTAFNVLITAVALFGFSASDSFWQLCLWAIPYGLGAGCVDASLNNYVALHYASRHMSWLHCMWGVGASAGPYIMGHALSSGQGWSAGYRYVSIVQFCLTVILFISLPLWRMQQGSSLVGAEDEGGGNNAQKGEEGERERKALALGETLRIAGAKEIMAAFFCYCALEQTTGLWASSYLSLYHGIKAEAAAWFASMFFIGITAGRALSGFLTLRLSDTAMIRLGQAIVLLGVAAILLPIGQASSIAGLILIGLGCAPIYPSIIHSTPAHFGAENSQAMIGAQMASAYVGACIMPPVFGALASRFGIFLFPLYLLAILALMLIMHESLIKKDARRRKE